MTTKEFLQSQKQEWFPQSSTFDRNEYPVCGSLSGSFFYRLIPNPTERHPPEFVFIKPDDNGIHSLAMKGHIAQWNMAWEAGHLRGEILRAEMPESFSWLDNYKDANIYLLPYSAKHGYYAHQHLLNLLPARTREKFGLPLTKRGIWPTESAHWFLDRILPKDFDQRLSKAMAYHIWPLINNSSRINRYTKSEPISLLAHNLNYWSPFLNTIIEEKLLLASPTPHKNEKDRRDAVKQNKIMPQGIYMDSPRMGEFAWYGEDEAWEVTKKLVGLANKDGQLSNIIDAIKSNRVSDDFSELWSREKEDFERKIYSKRSKIKVSFVEIDNAIPVHGPTSEVHEDLIWEDFIALLNPKEKQIVICLKNGITKLTDIGQYLNYANHSPISKAMTAIRKKAKALINL